MSVNKGKKENCVICGKQVCGKEKELHHAVSYDLAKVIVVKQLGEPETDEEHRYVQQTIKTFRKRNGKIPVCKGECHNKLNNKQKEMEKAIKDCVFTMKVTKN